MEPHHGRIASVGRVHLAPRASSAHYRRLGVVDAQGKLLPPELQFAGKTGTAQSGRKVNGVELNHAWFAGYAPLGNPQLVAVCLIEQGGFGGVAAARSVPTVQGAK